jgi:hypothetical protein
MDKTCAQVGRDKRGERRLVCPDCKAQQPDPLAAAVVSPKTAAQLAAALGTTLEAASAWLTEGLRGAGILLRLQAGRRTYWLPGVGIFALYLDRPGRQPLVGGPLGPLYQELQVRFKPQARTRGLPRLRAPSPAETELVSPAQRRALQRLVRTLESTSIPFQVTGGLAAIAYGAQRALYDIDIDVSAKDLPRVRDLFRACITHDIHRLDGRHFELTMLTLEIDGVPVDVSQAEDTYVKTADGRRVLVATELTRAARRQVGGLEVPVCALDELVAYKRLVDRPTDRQDVAAIT